VGQTQQDKKQMHNRMAMMATIIPGTDNGIGWFGH